MSGTSLGRYLLLHRLGKGGMGVVYEAEDNLLNRRVAVKLLPHGNRPEARMIERFFVEAQVAARLNHPNIIGIFDIGERSGNFFIVMELLNELSLGSYLRKHGALSWQEASRIALDCCSALQEAHLVGLVHRDIKPDNILCSPSGVIKVADFGLVKELTHNNTEGGQLTLDNAVVGSPQYMSPEQCRSHPVDSRSDIYSLGATYFAMLTGRSPYGTGAPMMLMVDHVSSPIPDPLAIVPDLPKECVAIIERAMQKDPDARFATAEEMRLELDQILANVSRFPYAFARPSHAPRQPVRQRRSENLRAALGDMSDRTIETDSAQTVDAPPPSTILERLRDGESSDEKRMARLEAALAMAPTAPIMRPTPAQLWRWRNSKWLIAAAALLVVVAVAIVGLYFSGQLTEAPVVQVAPPLPIKVGIVHSLSGPTSPMAQPIAYATLLAIDELNEQGGINGRPIEAVVVDGKADTESFAAATERLVTHDKVQALFGGLHSDDRRGIRKVVEAHDQLLLYPGESEGLEESPNIFYLGGVPSQRISPALRYCIQKLGFKRFFLVGSDVVYSRALSALLHDGITELGGRVVGERLVARGAPDFSAVLKKIASTEPDLVINTLHSDSNVYFFRLWEKRDKRLEEVSVMSLAMDENLLTLLDGTDVSQNYLAGNYFETLKRSENTAFSARFHKKYGGHRAITEAMEAAYSSVYLWAQAVRAAGDSDPQKVRKALKSQTFKGPSGLYQFDENTNYAWKSFHLAYIAPGNQLELVESTTTLLPPQIFPTSRTRPQWEALAGRM